VRVCMITRGTVVSKINDPYCFPLPVELSGLIVLLFAALSLAKLGMRTSRVRIWRRLTV